MSGHIVEKLRARGLIPDALRLLLPDQQIPDDVTRAFRCIRADVPGAHKNGDRRPSCYAKPTVGGVQCGGCGLDMTLLELAVDRGFGTDQADAARKLEAHFFGGNGHARGSASKEGAPKNKKPPYTDAEKRRMLDGYVRAIAALHDLRRKVCERFHISEETLTELRIGWKCYPENLNLAGRVVVPARHGDRVPTMKLRLLHPVEGEPKSKTHNRCPGVYVLGRDFIDNAPKTWPILHFAGDTDWLIAFERLRRCADEDRVDAVVVSSTGGEHKEPEDLAEWAPDRDHVLFVDNDGGTGLKKARKLAGRLKALDAKSIRLVGIQFPAGDGPSKDVFDFFERGGTVEDLVGQVEAAAAYEGPAVEREAKGTPTGEELILDPGDPLPSAREFLKQHYQVGEVPVLHQHKGEFLAWTGTHYPSIEEASIRARLYDWLSRACYWKGKPESAILVPYKPCPQKVGAVLDALRAATYLDGELTPPAWLAPAEGPDPKYLIACANGLLDLETGRLLPHDPRYFTKNAIDVAYDPKARSPDTWLKFLCDLWPLDSDSIYTLGEWFGYLLTADTKQQKLLLLVGPPRAGKGIIIKVLTALVGQSSTTSPSLSKLALSFGEQTLIDKRIGFVTDLRLGARTDQAAVAEKLLSISGGDPVTIPRKFLSDWVGYPTVRFVIASNELPRISDASGALASRFILLLLTESFLGREDPDLFTKIVPEELPGILNFAVEGWQRLKARGHFEQPESGREALRSLAELASPVGAFLRDRCEVGAAHEEKTDAVWNSWKTWCEDNGRGKPGTKAVFSRDLLAVIPGLKVGQVRDGSERPRVYKGLRVLSDGERRDR